jgi:acetoin utilization deacetylase AcuC-like enzyme
LHLDPDTYTTPASWEQAIRAAGGAAAVAEAVWTGHAQRGFALCRPPGHHAVPQVGMGFCLLNNIAVSSVFLRFFFFFRFCFFAVKADLVAIAARN